MKIKGAIVFLLCIVTLTLVIGCTPVNDEYTIKNDASDGWEEKTGEDITGTNLYRCEDDMNDSHSMMAAMILKQNDMDYDLNKYESVFLVKMVTKDGDERVMVVADCINVYPANIKDYKKE